MAKTKTQYKSSMRMGALNLLVLVIALCLVVLSVLSMVSANAMRSFTDRQEQLTTEYYTQEVAGQTFLASLDEGWKAHALDNNHNFNKTVVDGYMSLALARATAGSNGLECLGRADIISIEKLYEDMSIPYEIRGNLSNALEYLSPDDPSYCRDIATALEKCEKGIEMKLMMNDGKQLNAIVGLVSGGGIIVFDWEATREWEVHQEQLWDPMNSTNEQEEQPLVILQLNRPTQDAELEAANGETNNEDMPNGIDNTFNIDENNTISGMFQYLDNNISDNGNNKIE